MVLEYCPECGSILYPKKKEGGKKFLVCKGCKFEKEPDANLPPGFMLNPVKLDHELDKTLTKNDAYFKSVYGDRPSERNCPRCGGKMMMLVRQTRRADEGPTIFYTCVVCNKQIRVGS
jgi:DNA-directed RNA polymerase subunit M/transcription elongation factor TFIIS